MRSSARVQCTFALGTHLPGLKSLGSVTHKTLAQVPWTVRPTELPRLIWSGGRRCTGEKWTVTHSDCKLGPKNLRLQKTRFETTRNYTIAHSPSVSSSTNTNTHGHMVTMILILLLETQSVRILQFIGGIKKLEH